MPSPAAHNSLCPALPLSAATCPPPILSHQGMLELSDVQRRVAQFVAAGLPIVVTTACLLVDKARLLPGSSFVVSAWTLSLGIRELQHGWHRLCQCMPHCCLRVVWHDGATYDGECCCMHSVSARRPCLFGVALFTQPSTTYAEQLHQLQPV